MQGEQCADDLAQTGKHPLYQQLESRRAYPRLQLRLPVQIGLTGGQVVCARIYNLSPDGMQIRCDPGAALVINPSGRAISPGNGPEVLVAMRLHHGPDMRTQVIRCRVSYVLPESPKEVIIGLTFEVLLAAQREAIDAALDASLMPREP
jgi:hypothetical protein